MPPNDKIREALRKCVDLMKRANEVMLHEAGVGIVDLSAIAEAEALLAATPPEQTAQPVEAPSDDLDIDNEPYTAERLAKWLDAKYARHHEEEDEAAAKWIRRAAAALQSQAAETAELRTLIAEQAAALEACEAVTVAGCAMVSGVKALPLMQAAETAGEGSPTLNQRLTKDQTLQVVAEVANQSRAAQAAELEALSKDAERLIRLRRNVGNEAYEQQCEAWLAALSPSPAQGAGSKL